MRSWSDADAGGIARVGLSETYAVFCRGYWPVYWRYGAACAASVDVGVAVATAVIGDLEDCWPAVLSSPCAAAMAWELLVERASLRRTASVGRLYRLLERREADALLLRHKLGLSMLQGGDVMGLDGTEFALLSRRALRKITEQAG
ncbi:hypothetical protein [Streptomyces sp. NPDC057301]|uniref:hypothetical protein n=1 Tax=Streptomyces sp. NPDC057301 TaxID=3346093 RepID=UPI0036340214